VNGVLKSLRNRFRDESGQALVFVAVAMAVILGFAGLVVDVGQLHYAQSRLQAAADAAAVAGALEITYCGGTSNCSAMQAAAQKALVENGLAGSTLVTQCATGAGSGLTLIVNNGPCAAGSAANDPNYGNTNYVEAIVSESQPTFFVKALGIPSMKITARAEAAVGNFPFCIDTLGPSGTTFQVNGGTLTAACGILVNSTGSRAFVANGATITASIIDISGGDQITGSVSPTPITNAPSIPNPLSRVPTPTVGSCTYSTNYLVTGPATLNPGTYCGGITVNSGVATFNPGLYILEGAGLQVNGGGITGNNGVTFYFQTGSALFNGSYSINLVAPTTGTYAGILFFQNPSDASPATINGGPGSVFQGALDFPDAALQLNGGNVAAYTIVVSQSVQMNGGSFSIGNDYSSLPGGSPAKGVTAVLAE
jgi:Flp pilus assembly protein TadG